jgi:hypothetical protein
MLINVSQHVQLDILQITEIVFNALNNVPLVPIARLAQDVPLDISSTNNLVFKHALQEPIQIMDNAHHALQIVKHVQMLLLVLHAIVDI